MPATRNVPLITVDQYLALERAASERSEFVDGVIYAMAGESPEHGRISFNLVRIVGNHLVDKPREGRTKDTKVRSGPTPAAGQATKGMYSYPDIVVVCGEIEYHDAQRDVILNPTVIVEVLSPSTEAFDRGEKFHRYQMHNPTLKDYVLVTQQEAKVEVYSRSTEAWTYRWVAGLEAKIEIPSIACVLPLREVYERVEFPVSEEPYGSPDT